ncbi:MAG: hypothetical protein AMXMBFR33_73020 [Candidatus Xenobia bacterium]
MESEVELNVPNRWSEKGYRKGFKEGRGGLATHRPLLNLPRRVGKAVRRQLRADRLRAQYEPI